MTQTPITDDNVFGDDPLLEGDDWLYTVIMREIEPELAESSVEELDKKYEGESKEEKEAREKKYQKAFDMFDNVIGGLNQDLVTKTRGRAIEKKKKIAEQETAQRSEEMSAAEAKIDSLLTDDE